MEGRPRIWEYRSARKFVGDFVAYRKKEDPSFSYRKLSFLADLGSPNYVQMFVQGKRKIKPLTADKLARALGLSGEEREFFLVLTAYTQAEDPEEKDRWYSELLRLSVRAGTQTLDLHRLNYFRYWFVPVVHAMASLRGFVPDPEWISVRIVPPIRPKDAELALETLKELGILRVTGKEVEVSHPLLKTKDGLRSVWIKEYHRSMIRLAEISLEQWPPELRTTSALTVTVPEEKIPDVLSWVDQFRKDLFERIQLLQADTEGGVEGEVMQINFQAFLTTDRKGRFGGRRKVR